MRFIVAAAVQRVPREFNTKEFVSRAYIILKCTYEDTCKSTPVILQELIGVHPLTKRQFVYDLCSGSTLCRKEIMPLKSFMNWNSHACASEWQKVGTFFFILTDCTRHKYVSACCVQGYPLRVVQRLVSDFVAHASWALINSEEANV